MAVKGVIDVGTNSVKLLVMESQGGEWRVLLDRVEVARLGEGVGQSGLLAREAMERTLAVIGQFARDARALGSTEIAVVGTQALRMAGNTDVFLEAVLAETSLTIRVIDGIEEAALAFDAALSSLPDAGGEDAVCMFDIGGGSTEVVLGTGKGFSSRTSVEVGALALHNAFLDKGGGTVDGVALKKARAHVRALLQGRLEEKRAELSACRMAIGVGGTLTTMVAVMKKLAPYDPDAVTGTELGRVEIDRQIGLYASLPVALRAEIVGLNPKRADIILAGACIVRELLVNCGFQSVIVSNRGLRFGVMKRILGL